MPISLNHKDQKRLYVTTHKLVLEPNPSRLFLGCHLKKVNASIQSNALDFLGDDAELVDRGLGSGDDALPAEEGVTGRGEELLPLFDSICLTLSTCLT